MSRYDLARKRYDVRNTLASVFEPTSWMRTAEDLCCLSPGGDTE